MTAPEKGVQGVEGITKRIGAIQFHDISVNVYHDPYASKGKTYSAWQMRNPSTCYVGYMYMDMSTGKLSYPEGAIIPDQTDWDREMLPKAIITGETEITTKFVIDYMPHLESEYIYRNGKHEIL